MKGAPHGAPFSFVGLRRSDVGPPRDDPPTARAGAATQILRHFYTASKDLLMAHARVCGACAVPGSSVQYSSLHARCWRAWRSTVQMGVRPRVSARRERPARLCRRSASTSAMPEWAARQCRHLASRPRAWPRQRARDFSASSQTKRGGRWQTSSPRCECRPRYICAWLSSSMAVPCVHAWARVHLRSLHQAVASYTCVAHHSPRRCSKVPPKRRQRSSTSCSTRWGSARTRRPRKPSRAAYGNCAGERTPDSRAEALGLLLRSWP